MTTAASFDAQLRAAGLALLSEHGHSPSGELELAERLRETLPPDSPDHRPLRAEALRVLLALPEPAGGSEHTARRAALHCDHGLELLGLGERIQAYAAIERSVALYRELDARDPSHRRGLAAALINLGATLSALGDETHALEHTAEAVDLLRELGENPADQASLARAQHNLATYALDEGDYTRGHALANEAVSSYRALVERLPRAHADLVDALDTLARALILRELDEELIRAMGEANRVHERLQELDPSAASQRLPAYAKRSIKLCARLSDLGQIASAVEHAQRALAAYRELASHDPSFRTKLAAAHQHLSVNLSLAGRDLEALAASRETVAQWRALASEDPEEFTDKLIAALGNLGQDLDTLGRDAEAVEVARERLALLEPLAASAPDEHGGELVEQLANLALDLSGLEQHEEALRLANEAVEHARPLAARDPDSYEPELAHALDVRGSIESTLGQHEAAYASYREGLRKLAPHYAIEPRDYEALREELLSDLRELCAHASMPWPAELT